MKILAVAVEDWFKDHDFLMFQLQLTNIRLIANSVALLNMFIPMASPERATNLIGAISWCDAVWRENYLM